MGPGARYSDRVPTRDRAVGTGTLRPAPVGRGGGFGGDLSRSYGASSAAVTKHPASVGFGPQNGSPEPRLPQGPHVTPRPLVNPKRPAVQSAWAAAICIAARLAALCLP